MTLVVHFELPDVPPSPPAPQRVVGVDLGLHDLAVLSDGTRTPAPKQYRRAEGRLKRLQRQLSRCQKGTRNREKLKAKVARLHLRVANQRRDRHHKLSAALVRQYDAIAVEDLNVKGLGRTNLAKSVHDAGWAQLRFMLSYKTRWVGKQLAVVGRFFPSSRLCRACGAINDALTLSARVWRCGCGAVHDRDLNAARNIRDQGLQLLRAGLDARCVPAPREPGRPATGRRSSMTGEASALGLG